MVVPHYVFMRNPIASVPPAFDPGALPGVQLYIDPSLGNGVGFTADGSYVIPTSAGGILDQSSYSRDSNYTQPTAYGGDPADQINGLDVIDFAHPSYSTFDGVASTIYSNSGSTREFLMAAVVNRSATTSSDFCLFTLPYIANQDHQTVIVLFKPSDAVEVTCGNGSGYSNGGSLQTAISNLTLGINTTALVVVSGSATTAAIRVRINGVEATMTYNQNGTSMPMANFLSGTGSSTLNFRVAARQHSAGTFPLNGKIGDFLVLDNIPDASTLSELENHLMTKWGIV